MRRSERGAAATEYAIMMIVLVPIILYSVFLMDAAYLKIDLQEAVVSGVWDWSTRNTEAFKDDEMKSGHDENQQVEKELTQKLLRAVYSDHTSSFDDGIDPTKPGYNSLPVMRSNVNHQKHHTGFGAQYSFQWKTEDEDGERTVGEDTQFACSLNDDDLGWALEPNLRSYGKSKWSVGAKVHCEATGWIYNYIVPRDFMPEFSQVSMTDMERRSGDVHGHHNAEHGSGGSAADIRSHSSAAISFNTWALRSGARDGSLGSQADIGEFGPFLVVFDLPENPNGNPLYERVRYLYVKNSVIESPSPIGTYAIVAARAAAFTNKARSEQLAIVTTVPFPLDTVLWMNPLPNLAGIYVTARYKPTQTPVRQKPPGFLAAWAHQGFQSTPYEGINDDYKVVHGKRGTHYMGCRDAESPGCN